jgi:hypothetical protein
MIFLEGDHLGYRMAVRWLSAFAASLLFGAFVDQAHAQRGRRPGRLVIQTSSPDAEVLVDEESVGTTPIEDPIELAPGEHTVRVRRPGYTEFSDVVRIRPNETTELAVDLMALAMVLTVRSTPEEARVFVDGTFRGTTPIELELVEGDHSVRVTHPTHRETIREVTAVAGQTQLLDLTLEAIPQAELRAAQTTEWYEEPVVWISIAGGAVALAVVIVLIAVFAPGGSQINDFCGGDMESCIRVSPDWTF